MFYSIETDWLQTLKNNHTAIKNELDLFLKHNNTSFESNYSAYTNNNGWSTIPLIFFTIKNNKFLDCFPQTKELLLNIPELIGAEFSILKPNTLIKPHIGYSKAVMRTHLGLKVPKGDLGLKCSNDIKSWNEGSTFSFNDGEMHEAWNNSEEERWVLMIDTPTPESKYNANEISTYKLNQLDDPILLQIGSKDQWLNWLSVGFFE